MCLTLLSIAGTDYSSGAAIENGLQALPMVPSSLSLSKTKQSTAYLTLEASRSCALKKAALTPSCQVRAIALFMVWLCLTVQLDPLYAPVPSGSTPSAAAKGGRALWISLQPDCTLCRHRPAILAHLMKRPHALSTQQATHRWTSL